MRHFKSLQDILNYAIDQEQEANSFYQRLAQQVTKTETQSALKKFAMDELQHKFRLEGIRDGQAAFINEEVGNLGIADSIGEVKPHIDMSYKELLALAIKNEQKAYTLYSKLALVAQVRSVKDLFLHLAQEEAQHKLNLEFEYDLTTF